MAAVLLGLGIVTFRHFEQRTRLWRRVLKMLGVLVITAVISHYFGTTGVIVAFSVALLPVIYIHAVWLPRHGVNGWTGEPREKYYALRGWVPPDRCGTHEEAPVAYLRLCNRERRRCLTNAGCFSPALSSRN